MIRITIKTDNAAFQDGNRAAEVCNILRAVARRFELETAGEGFKLRDSNGNSVGTVTLTGKDREL